MPRWTRISVALALGAVLALQASGPAVGSDARDVKKQMDAALKKRDKSGALDCHETVVMLRAINPKLSRSEAMHRVKGRSKDSFTFDEFLELVSQEPALRKMSASSPQQLPPPSAAALAQARLPRPPASSTADAGGTGQSPAPVAHDLSGVDLEA